LLGGSGFEKGIGSRIWSLLHGVDPSEVKEATDYPTQISIEDTYKGLKTIEQITDELHKLARSLVRRIRTDLLTVIPESQVAGAGTERWVARPKTLRLSIRSWPADDSSESRNFSRISRSGLVPNFLLDTKAEIVDIAHRLVVESLLPLFRRFENSGSPQWNLQLMNICVANLVPSATENKAGVGRDIAAMFKNQDEALRPFRITSSPECEKETDDDEADGSAGVTNSQDFATDSYWGDARALACPICGFILPPFAQVAHARYHSME
jgi:DNA polymerase iota